MLNISSNLYKSEWLDVVFKNRNKNYGAYVLRSESDGTTLRALFIGAPVFILLFASPIIYKHFNPVVEDSRQPDRVIEVLDVIIPKVEKLKKEVIPPAPSVTPVTEKVKMIALPSRPIVVDDPVNLDPPMLKDLEKAVVGPLTQDGVETDLIVAPSTGTGSGVSNGTGTDTGIGTEDNTIHDSEGLQAYPEFAGGMKGWAKFIQRNLRYPSMAQEVGVQGKVFVSFVIEKDGTVSNVKVERGIGSGCDEEAMRVIKKSPKWKPGIQNNQHVRVRYTMPLSFMLSQF